MFNQNITILLKDNESDQIYSGIVKLAEALNCNVNIAVPKDALVIKIRFTIKNRDDTKEIIKFLDYIYDSKKIKQYSIEYINN